MAKQDKYTKSDKTYKKPKKKTCRTCKKKFSPFSSLSVVCSTLCAIKYASVIKKKKDRKMLKVARERLKTKSDHLKDAQTACNAFIRERDKNEPCISCGTRKLDIQYCAGHYKTRGGHPELRFHPFNISKQCNKNCNLHQSGNILAYRPNLINKIGLKNVEWLEGKHQAQNLTIEDIKEIRSYYKEQLKILKSV